MFRKLTAAALALTIGMATVPAFALPSPELARSINTTAHELTKKVAPIFKCDDPTDRDSCMTKRVAVNDDGVYSILKWAGNVEAACFQPTDATYRHCTIGDDVVGTFLVGNAWNVAPIDDVRCKAFGDNLSADYLTCEAALPVKS